MSQYPTGDEAPSLDAVLDNARQRGQDRAVETLRARGVNVDNPAVWAGPHGPVYGVQVPADVADDLARHAEEVTRQVRERLDEGTPLTPAEAATITEALAATPWDDTGDRDGLDETLLEQTQPPTPVPGATGGVEQEWEPFALDDPAALTRSDGAVTPEEQADLDDLGARLADDTAQRVGWQARTQAQEYEPVMTAGVSGAEEAVTAAATIDATVTAAIDEGTRLASARAAQVGAQPGTVPVTATAATTLAREGAIATLETRTQLERDPNPSLDDTATAIRRLTASPWDDGPTRRTVIRDLDTRVVALGGTAPSVQIQRAQEQPDSTAALVAGTAAAVTATTDRQRLTAASSEGRTATISATSPTLERIKTKIDALRAQQEPLMARRANRADDPVRNLEAAITAPRYPAQSASFPAMKVG